MEVQKVILDANKKRYMLLNDGGIPVASVMRYLKYLDVTGKTSNTQKTYCLLIETVFYVFRSNFEDDRKS
jgi:integrase/recombinase XerD